MQARPALLPPSGQQLSFSELFPDPPGPFPAALSARGGVRRRRLAARPTPPANPAPAAQDPAAAASCLRPAAGPQDDFATQAPANAHELHARLRNSLTALSTATLLMVRHAPESPQVVELSAVMRRQIDLLCQQIQTLEEVAAYCEAADI